MNILAHITWDVDPEIIDLGFVAPRWYGLLFAIALILGYLILQWIFKQEKKNPADLESLTIYLIFATVIGARLGHCLFYAPEEYLPNPIKILEIWKGGLASHGAGFGILIGIALFIRKHRHLKISWVFDRVAILVPLAAMFVRFGNFINSEIVGMPSDLPWAVVFVRDIQHEMVPRHPTQLYEGLAYLIIFIVLLFTYKKYKEKLPAGLTSGLMLILLFGARFTIEFFKENQSAFESGLPIDMGQILSIPFILTGFYFLIRSRKNKE